MKKIPKEEGIDHSLSVLKEGYDYIPNRMKQFESSIFETKLLGERVICLTGEEAGELFYDNEKFVRAGAAPKHVKKTLLGDKGVHTLVGRRHHHRKAMFMELMNDAHIKQLGKLVADEWETKLNIWGDGKNINLYETSQEVLTRSVVRWAGVPLEEKDVSQRTKQLVSLFESPTSVDLEYLQGSRARKDLEEWIIGLIQDVRGGRLQPPLGTALLTFSEHRDLEGQLLDEHTAAVEVLNILRPTVAVSIYIAFLGHALIMHPEERNKLEESNEGKLENFVEEVRRLYPFFPFNAARVKEDFVWKEFSFEKETLVIFDFHGTDHEEKNWPDPYAFQPDRFNEDVKTLYNFVPQGGGEYATSHRCAGEWITIEAMKTSLDYLANRMEFDVPEQSMSISKTSIPTIPEDEILLNNVHRK